MTPDYSHPSPDYSGFSTPELNKLIHDFSVESRNRYEVQKELEVIRQYASKQALDELVRHSGLYPNNIDAKASVSPSEAITDAE